MENYYPKQQINKNPNSFIIIVEEFIQDLFGKGKFLHLVFRSLLISLLIVILANEYYHIIKENVWGNLLFILTLFFVIYVFYVNKEIKNAQ